MNPETRLFRTHALRNIRSISSKVRLFGVVCNIPLDKRIDSHRPFNSCMGYHCSAMRFEVLPQRELIDKMLSNRSRTSFGDLFSPYLVVQEEQNTIIIFHSARVSLVGSVYSVVEKSSWFSTIPS